MSGFIWPDRWRREVLPIDSRLSEILGLIAANQVVVCEAETGAGKTTRIGQAAVLADPTLRVIMTQTRRNAVRWNGKRIAQELGCQPGGLVGWKLFGEDPVVSRETRLTLVIDQSLTNQIRRQGRLPEGLLIIDEAHERSVSTDLLLGLIKEALPDSPKTRVLITSATIDTRKFSEFFGGVPVLSVAGRVFPVAVPEVVRLGKFEHHTQGAARAAEKVFEQFLKNELVVPKPEGEGTQAVSKGTVLVLLPGKDDIAEVMRSVTRKAENLKAVERVEVLSCHGETSPEEQDKIQLPLKACSLRFVCGTEILRTSVTVRDTVGVIDSLQVKRLLTDAKGVAHLDKIAISRAEADQGKGRAGRTAPGFYIPSSFEREYEGLSPYPTPAILREPITHVALQVAAVGRSVRDFAFIDPPDKEKVNVAITRLKRLGALDENEEITEVGEILVQFPVDPERAKVLVTADRLGILAEAVVVTAVMESEGIFFRPREERGKKYLADEPLLRILLSHLQPPDKSYSWREWEKAEKPRDPKEVDLSVLPEGIEKKGEPWEVDFGYRKCPGDIRWLGDLVRRSWAGESRSDFAAIVRCYRAFKAEERRLKLESLEDRPLENGSPRPSREQALRSWCERWNVNYKRIRMAEHVMHQIREELASSPLRLDNGLAQEREFSAEDLTKALASGLVDNVARGGGRFGYSGPIGEFQLAYQSACPQGSSLILVGGVNKIPTTGRRGGTAFIFLADLAAPVEPSWLAEIMPQLCSRKRLGDHQYDQSRDIVAETEEQFFVDLKVGEPRVKSIDTAAAQKTFCAWLAQEMAQGRGY